MRTFIVSKTGVGFMSAALAAALAFPAGYVFAGQNTAVAAMQAPVVAAPVNTAAMLAQKKAAEDSALIDEMAQNTSEATGADMTETTPASAPARPSMRSRDPEMDRDMRHAIEFNEMLCSTNGQNCEAARLARRQYNEDHER
jgi:hypothetical protein